MKSSAVNPVVLRSRKLLTFSVGLITTILFLASCGGSTEPVTAVRIVPSAQTFAIQPTVRGPTLQVSVTVTNTSSNPIYYWSCAVRLQRKADGPVALNSDGIWMTVWSPICSAEATVPPPTLQPGESVTIPITAVVSTDPQYLPNFDGMPGLYRAQFSLATKVLGFTRQLSEEESSSAGFTVVAN